MTRETPVVDVGDLSLENWEQEIILTGRPPIPAVPPPPPPVVRQVVAMDERSQPGSTERRTEFTEPPRAGKRPVSPNPPSRSEEPRPAQREETRPQAQRPSGQEPADAAPPQADQETQPTGEKAGQRSAGDPRSERRTVRKETRRRPAAAPPRSQQTLIDTREIGRAFLALFIAAAFTGLIGVGVWFVVEHQKAPVATADPPEPGAETVAIARLPVRMRAAPDVLERVVMVIPAGRAVTVQERRTDGFFKVTYGGMHGYASAAYFAVTDGTVLVPHIEGRIADISGKARIREAGSLSALTVAAVPSGATVTVMGFTTTGWVLVWAGSRAGFVWGGLLEDNPALPLRPRNEGRERVVENAGRTLRPS